MFGSQRKRKKEAKEFANRFVIVFFQNGRGGSTEGKVDILNQAMVNANIPVTYHQEKINGETKSWFHNDIDDSKVALRELERAERFKNDILNCHPRGQVEWESNAVEEVINNYKEGRR